MALLVEDDQIYPLVKENHKIKKVYLFVVYVFIYASEMVLQSTSPSWKEASYLSCTEPRPTYYRCGYSTGGTTPDVYCYHGVFIPCTDRYTVVLRAGNNSVTVSLVELSVFVCFL